MSYSLSHRTKTTPTTMRKGIMKSEQIKVADFPANKLWGNGTLPTYFILDLITVIVS